MPSIQLSGNIFLQSFVCAAADGDENGIAQESFDGVGLGIAIGAEGLDGVSGDFFGTRRAKEFCRIGIDRGIGMPIDDSLRRRLDERLHGSHFGIALCNHLLYLPKFIDFFAKCDALRRIIFHTIDASLGNSARLRG